MPSLNAHARPGSLHGMCGQDLGLSRSSTGQLHSVNNKRKNFSAGARDSCLTLRRSFSLLLDEFRASLDSDDIFEEVPMPLLTE